MSDLPTKLGDLRDAPSFKVVHGGIEISNAGRTITLYRDEELNLLRLLIQRNPIEVLGSIAAKADA